MVWRIAVGWRNGIRRRSEGAGRVGAVARVLVAILASSLLAGCIERNVDESVVRIRVNLPNGYGIGTGFVVAPEGYVVTNHHVVDAAIRDPGRVITVQTEGEDSQAYRARVTWSSSGLDLAILRAPELQAPPLVINRGELEKQDPLVAVGFPGAADVIDQKREAVTISTQTGGRVSRVVRTDMKNEGVRLKVIQHTATINPGNSGGPLLNACSQVVGVNTAGAASNLKLIGERVGLDIRQGTFFSSHADELARILEVRGIDASITDAHCDPDQRFTMLAASIGFLSLLAFAAMAIAFRGITGGGGGGRTGLTGIFRRGGGSIRGGDAGTVYQGTAAGELGDHYLVPRAGAARGGELRIPADVAQAAGVVVGREPGPDGVVVEEKALSRRHLMIRLGRDGYTIEDLGSRNGTRVNGRKLNDRERAVLASGDQVRVGGMTFEFMSYDDMRKSERSQRPSGAQWILSGFDPRTNNAISIAFDEAIIRAKGGRLVIGRDGAVCDFAIPHPTVSGDGHAKITIENDAFTITDMGSTNGTKVDGRKLGDPGVPLSLALAPGQTVTFGTVPLQVSKNS